MRCRMTILEFALYQRWRFGMGKLLNGSSEKGYKDALRARRKHIGQGGRV